MSISLLAFKIRKVLLVSWWKLRVMLKINSLYDFRLPDGSTFIYPLNSAVGCALFTNGFESAEVEFVCQTIKKGDIFFDVGANGGLYTIIASQIVGDTGHVYAFEPGTRELQMLKKNIEFNSLKNVTVIAAAVGEQSGESQLAISRDGAMNSLMKNEHPAQQVIGWQETQLVTLEQIIKQFNIKKINFIKIDIEGGEWNALKGAHDYLKTSKSLTILFEASNSTAKGFGYTVEELLRYIDSLGFKLFFLGLNQELQEIKGFDNTRFGSDIYNFIAIK